MAKVKFMLAPEKNAVRDFLLYKMEFLIEQFSQCWKEFGSQSFSYTVPNY
jgi:hypothetical protein